MLFSGSDVGWAASVAEAPLPGARRRGRRQSHSLVGPADRGRDRYSRPRRQRPGHMYTLRIGALQPFSQKPRTPTVAPLLQIGLCDPVKADFVLLTSKKWRLQRAGRPSRRQGVEMKLDWLFHKPRSNYWLRAAASNLASQSPCLAGVTRSQCNPQ